MSGTADIVARGGRVARLGREFRWPGDRRVAVRVREVAVPPASHSAAGRDVEGGRAHDTQAPRR